MRVATSDDLARLTELLDDAVSSTPTVRAGHLRGFPRRHVASRQRLTDALQSEAQIVFAGLLETHVIGVALASLNDSMPGGLLAQVEELYVEPEARELGIGEALLDACTQWARDKGCSGIEVEALPGARSAKNLAERSGYTARLITLYRKL